MSSSEGLPQTGPDESKVTDIPHPEHPGSSPVLPPARVDHGASAVHVDDRSSARPVPWRGADDSDEHGRGWTSAGPDRRDVPPRGEEFWAGPHSGEVSGTGDWRGSNQDARESGHTERGIPTSPSVGAGAYMGGYTEGPPLPGSSGVSHAGVYGGYPATTPSGEWPPSTSPAPHPGVGRGGWYGAAPAPPVYPGGAMPPPASGGWGAARSPRPGSRVYGACGPSLSVGGCPSAALVCVSHVATFTVPPGANLFVFYMPSYLCVCARVRFALLTFIYVCSGESHLHALFSAYGPVLSCTVIVDPVTGQSKGYGFVSYSDARMAEVAISRLNGTKVCVFVMVCVCVCVALPYERSLFLAQIGSKRLKVEHKRRRGERGPTPYRGGYGGG
jgi:hypothetical protein